MRTQGGRAIRGALLLGALLVPSAALADARIEARRHFRKGMSLIQGGAIDEGVSELKEAYAIKPHPNVLYNIGRAYQEAGRTAEAVEFYRRYLATNPPDAAEIEPVAEKLAASLPPPEEKKPPEERRPPPEERPSRNAAVDAETMKRMQALLDRLEGAVAKAEAVASKPPPEAAPAAQTSGVPEGLEEGGESAVPYQEVVVTASRRAQSTLEASNSTTVITAEEIRESGARSVVDLLRRVPGAEVMEMGVSSANVSFRGFNQRIANKVLVLVDGRTEYQDFLGLTIWPQIPIQLQEIERIEIIRGPGSALYGANAMLGVINIITKAPGTGPRAEFDGIVGTGNTASGSMIVHSEDKGFRYRASAGYGQEDKWSRDFETGRPDFRVTDPDPNRGVQDARGNLTLLYNFSRDVNASASGGVTRLYTELYPLGSLRNYYLDGVSGYAKADFGAGPVKLKFFWNHLDGSSGPQYEPLGERSLQTHVESNVLDGEALFAKEFELAGRHAFNGGLSARLKRVGWTYMDQFHQELHAAAFAQDEWRIIDPVRVVASYRIDRHPLLNNGSPGYAQSPRVSALWMPFEGQAFRASAATAFREPTFLESYVDLYVPLRGFPSASALTLGNQQLKPEQLTAFELGYRGENAGVGIDWDVAVYWNVVNNLITLSGLGPPNAQGNFNGPTNTYVIGTSYFQNEPAQYTARGAELGAHYSPVDGLDVRASGAFENISAANLPANETCAPCQQVPAVKLHGNVAYRSKIDLELSVDGSYVSSTKWIERAPSVDDPTQIIETTYPLGGYVVINARLAYNIVKDHLMLALVGSQLGPDHQEHPFGNLVTRRFFATLTVRP